jgi:hypothetical protein
VDEAIATDTDQKVECAYLAQRLYLRQSFMFRISFNEGGIEIRFGAESANLCPRTRTFATSRFRVDGY